MTHQEQQRFGMIPAEPTKPVPNFPPRLDLADDCKVGHFGVRTEGSDTHQYTVSGRGTADFVRRPSCEAQ